MWHRNLSRLEGVLEEAIGRCFGRSVKEIIMREQIDHLFKEVRTKHDGAEKRIKA